MAVYRFLAYDLRTNALLGELPIGNATYERVLNGAGSFGGYVSLGRKTTTGAQLDTTMLAATLPHRTALYVERDGVLMWGGVLWGRQYNSTNHQLQLRGAEFWSYYRRRINATTQTFAGVDQLTIARTVVAAANAKIGGDIGITLDATVSGVLLSRTYNSWERAVVASVVEELAKAEDGFDFAIDVAYNTSGVPTKTLNLGYPRRGRTAGTNDLVFELGYNLGYYTYDEDGTRAANVVHVLGPGEGAAMLVSTATQSAVIDAGYPIVEDTVSRKGGGVPPTVVDLGRYAQAAVNARYKDVASLTIQNIFLDKDPPLGSWIVGDDIRFRVPDDYRFPAQASGSPGLDRYFRIIGDTVNVADAGVETASLTCAELQSA